MPDSFHCLIVYPTATDLLVLDNPIVVTFYTTKESLNLHVNASFFELGGWVADKQIYFGIFNPDAAGWKSKSKGEVMIKFAGDELRTKCSLKVLLQHGLTLLPPAADIVELSDSSEPSPPQTPKNVPQPGAIDPNRTQSYGDDSSDDDGAHKTGGTVHALPAIVCCARALHLSHMRFLHARRFGPLVRFWTSS